MKSCKILSAVLIVSLFLGINTAFSLEYPIDIDGHSNEVAVKLAFYLEVFEDDEIAINETVSRGEFVSLVIKMMGLRFGGQPQKQLFFDVPVNHEYAEDIYYAYNLGIISGSSDGFFNVSKEITAQEASSVIVKGLNYTFMAEQYGGYPVGFMSVASRLNLFNNVKLVNDDKITRAAAAQLLYNAMRVDKIIEYITDDGDIVHKTVRGNTILEDQYNIYHTRGVITANRHLTIPAGNGVANDKVIIENTAYLVNDTDADKLLGYRVEALYIEEEDEKELIAISTAPSNVLRINAGLMDRYEPGSVYYYPSATENKVIRKVSDVAVTILNNEVYKMPEEGMEIPELGYFEFIDNNNDDIYDVVSVKSYETVIVNSVDDKRNVIYDKQSTANIIDLSFYEDVSIAFDSGMPLELSDLKEDDVLAIASRSDKTFLEIIVTRNRADIIVQAMFGEYGTTFENDITLVDESGVEYSVSKSYYRNNSRQVFNTGNKYAVLFNKHGEIAWASIQQNMELEYAYLLKYGKGRSILNSSADIQLFIMSVDLLTVSTASKVLLRDAGQEEMLSGLDLIDRLDAKKESSTDGYYEGLVRYRLNSNGELVELELPSDNRFDKGFRKIGESSSSNNSASRYRTSTKTIGGTILIGTETKTLYIPEKANRDYLFEYEVLSNDFFVSDKYYKNCIAFTSKDDSMKAEIVITQDSEQVSVVSDADPLMLVEKISKAIDDKFGSNHVRIEGFADNSYVGFNIVEGYGAYEREMDQGEWVKKDDIQPGDIIQYKLNSNGHIVSLKVVYQLSTNTIKKAGSAGVASDFNCIKGLAKGSIGNVLFINQEGYEKAEDSLYIINYSTGVYTYDANGTGRTKGEIVSGNDIVTLDDDSQNASKLVVSSRATLPRIVVIYK